MTISSKPLDDERPDNPLDVEKPEPRPEDYLSYFAYLHAVRKHKRLRMVDVSNASAHPDFPKSKAKMSSLSRMENGEVKNPSFRHIIYYARGYGVKFEDLAFFFKEEYERAKKTD